jgi:hypothetical protein
VTNPNKVGLIHQKGCSRLAVSRRWSALVLIGWAQPILDFIFWAHIKPVYFVKPFDPMAAVCSS